MYEMVGYQSVLFLFVFCSLCAIQINRMMSFSIFSRLKVQFYYLVLYLLSIISCCDWSEIPFIYLGHFLQ